MRDAASVRYLTFNAYHVMSLYVVSHYAKSRHAALCHLFVTCVCRPRGTDNANSHQRTTAYQEVWRSYLAMFGFGSKQMTTQIGMLSDGQKSRLVFAMMAMKPYNILLLASPAGRPAGQPVSQPASQPASPAGQPASQPANQPTNQPARRLAQPARAARAASRPEGGPAHGPTGQPAPGRAHESLGRGRRGRPGGGSELCWRGAARGSSVQRGVVFANGHVLAKSGIVRQHS